MTITEFEKEFCLKEIPTQWNVYAWIREHKNTAIAQAFFRTRRILNRANYVTIGISGGKDSTLAFEIASLELRYRRQLIKAINDGLIDEPYEYKNIRYDKSAGINDFDNLDNIKTEEYESFEDINLNIPMLILNSQDCELIFSDTCYHIQYDMNLAHGYGLYNFDGKTICGFDIVPKAVREDISKVTGKTIEIYADLWDELQMIKDYTSSNTDSNNVSNRNSSSSINNMCNILSISDISDTTESDLKTIEVNDKLIEQITKNRFAYAGKKMTFKTTNTSNVVNHNFTCIVHGDQSGHMFYKCLSIAYQDGTSFSSGRFTAWDITKKDIWCRPMPKREDHGVDIITNYNMRNVNYLPISKINHSLVEKHADQIVEIDGVKCICNWGLGKTSLCEIEKTFGKVFGDLMMKVKDIEPGKAGTKEGEEWDELWTWISQSDEDAGGSESNTFSRWLIGSVPDETEVKYVDNSLVDNEMLKIPTQIYNLISLRSVESFDRFTILKQSIYATGQYATVKA